MARKYDYRNKVIAITGGAGGIGSAFCRAVAPLGARVIVVDRNPDSLNQLLDELTRLSTGTIPTQFRSICADLTDRGEVEETLANIEAHEGRLDVLINNMGMTSAERFDQRSLESIELELTVNLSAPLMLTRLAIPLLHQSHDARVISTVSLGGIFPLGETPVYTASKFGLRGAMLSIGLDLRVRGITAGSVLPSATDTPMLAQEALDGGNALQFQDPPQQPHQVAEAMMSLLDKPRLEVYPKLGESWLVRAAMLVPNLLPRIMPLFRKKGERGQARYIAELQERGIAQPSDSSGQ